MRSKFEAKIERQTKQKKSTARPGGKALQRLFAYLGERDPRLNDQFIVTIPVPKAARPKFGLTKRAFLAKPGMTARHARAAPTAAKSYATAMAKAAAAPTA